jgi:hypothetical protein
VSQIETAKHLGLDPSPLSSIMLYKPPVLCKVNNVRHIQSKEKNAKTSTNDEFQTLLISMVPANDIGKYPA